MRAFSICFPIQSPHLIQMPGSFLAQPVLLGIADLWVWCRQVSQHAFCKYQLYCILSFLSYNCYCVTKYNFDRQEINYLNCCCWIFCPDIKKQRPLENVLRRFRNVRTCCVSSRFHRFLNTRYNNFWKINFGLKSWIWIFVAVKLVCLKIKLFFIGQLLLYNNAA